MTPPLAVDHWSRYHLGRNVYSPFFSAVTPRMNQSGSIFIWGDMNIRDQTPTPNIIGRVMHALIAVQGSRVFSGWSEGLKFKSRLPQEPAAYRQFVFLSEGAHSYVFLKTRIRSRKRLVSSSENVFSSMFFSGPPFLETWFFGRMSSAPWGNLWDLATPACARAARGHLWPVLDFAAGNWSGSVNVDLQSCHWKAYSNT